MLRLNVAVPPAKTPNTNSDYLKVFPYLGTPGGGYQSKPGVPAAS